MQIYKAILHINAIIVKIFLKIFLKNRITFGKKTTFRKRFNVFVENNAKIEIGDNCFFNNDCSLNARNQIKIGNNTIMGENVKIYDHNHVFKDKNKKIVEQGFKSEKVSIGNNCWIGSNTVILKGVTIGDNVIIGAGCVISDNIKDNKIVRNKECLEVEDRK